MPDYLHYQQRLDALAQDDCLRTFRQGERRADQFVVKGHAMLDLSSNDYLGLARSEALKAQFFALYPPQQHTLSSSSSRLLTGNFAEHDALERALDAAYGRQSLLFNSGYHMNIGILPAIADAHTLIVSDELIHASMIDGIRLSRAQRQRFAHQDFAQLELLLQAAQQESAVERILVVTESLFSMDGDLTDLAALVALKKRYHKVMLYVDEAHAVGIHGARGLGVAEASGCLADIDFLLGTFGKALASMGGFVVCDAPLRDYLINTCRSLIFSTALPPINVAWSRFVFEQMQTMQDKRQHLQQLTEQLRTAVQARRLTCPGHGHIVPVVYGANEIAVEKAALLQREGFHVLPIRPPTVAPGSARVRLCLHADLTWAQLETLVAHL